MEILKEYSDMVIFSLLGLMGFLALFFTLERIIFYWRLKPQNYTTKSELQEALDENLIYLYVIYSNAPYVGLLGTILGIMVVFYEMNGNIQTQTITMGLSLALKATALGLVVAIPTLIAYHLFSNKAEKILARQ